MKPILSNYKIWLFVCVLSSLLLSTCKRTENINVTEDLLQADRLFSEYSIQHGMIKAFLQYCAEDAVILKSDHDPISGKENITSLLMQSDDSEFILSWEPQYAKVSRSADLGFTYGIYRIHSKGNNGEKLMASGTYISVWEKDENGQWKFVLDTGNEGLTKDRLLKEIQKIKSIAGNWYYETDEGIYYEKWESVGDSMLKGHSCLLDENDTVYFENTRIEIVNNDIVYTADVSNQNDSSAIIFKLSEKKKNQYVFSNKEHDFPQRIIYYLPEKNDTMMARIEGFKNDKELSKDYYYKRLNLN